MFPVQTSTGHARSQLASPQVRRPMGPQAQQVQHERDVAAAASIPICRASMTTPAHCSEPHTPTIPSLERSESAVNGSETEERVARSTLGARPCGSTRRPRGSPSPPAHTL